MKWEKLKKDLINSKWCYFHTDKGILLCGDCLTIMNKFPEECIDLIITSPPYNVGIEYDVWDDELPPEEYFKFVKKFLKLFKKVLKSDGRFGINILYEVNMRHTGKETRLSLLCEYYALLKEVGLRYNTIVDLVEARPQRGRYTAWGSWISASSPYIYNPKECILIGYKESWKKKKRGKSTINKELFKEIVSGMWSYRAETQGLTKANFSEDIPYKAIQGLSYENDLVLDPFAGSGTTLVIAERLKRRWIGIEISEKYCEIIKRRIEKELKQLKIFSV